MGAGAPRERTQSVVADSLHVRRQRCGSQVPGIMVQKPFAAAQIVTAISTLLNKLRRQIYRRIALRQATEPLSGDLHTVRFARRRGDQFSQLAMSFQTRVQLLECLAPCHP